MSRPTRIATVIVWVTVLVVVASVGGFAFAHHRSTLPVKSFAAEAKPLVMTMDRYDRCADCAYSALLIEWSNTTNRLDALGPPPDEIAQLVTDTVNGSTQAVESWSKRQCRDLDTKGKSCALWEQDNELRSIVDRWRVWTDTTS
jgi:hypothetical protein